MKTLSLTLSALVLLAGGGLQAQNVWKGTGVPSGTGSSDWTLGTNYVSGAPTFTTATDLDFSTISAPGAGVTLSAGTGGTYGVKDLYFGKTTSALATAEAVTFNGNGTAGATTVSLAGKIFMPNITGSVVTLGNDLTIDLTNAVHTVQVQTTPNLLILNSLITGGGTSASINTSLGGTTSLIFTNNNSSYVTAMGTMGTRFESGYLGFTSIAGVGLGAAGNSSLGNATTATTGVISLANSMTFNFQGSSNSTTDRNLIMAGTLLLGNSSTGTNVTYNGTLTSTNTGNVEVRAIPIAGSTITMNSVITDNVVSGTNSIRMFTGNYLNSVTGASTANNGLGTFVVGGANTFSGLVLIGQGTLQVGNNSALGNTTGNTQVSGTGVLDLNGFSVPENITLASTAAGGGLINSNTTTGAATSGTVQVQGTTNALGGAGNLTISAGITESAATKAINKVGAGRLTLGGASSYTGTTTVTGGTLLVNGSIASTALTSVTAAGTLGGTGSLAGGATFASGGTINPGVDLTPGLFTISGPLTLVSGSVYRETLDTMAGLGFDRVSVGATAALGGSSLVLDFGTNFVSNAAVGQTFSILNSTGALSGVFAQGALVSGTSGGFNYNFGIGYGTNSVLLTLNNISAVPEPSTWAMIAASVPMGLMAIRRRRNS